MIFELFWCGLIVSWLIGLCSGPIGCILSWKKMTNLGDAFSHIIPLGFVFSYWLSLNYNIGILIILVLFIIFISIAMKFMKEHINHIINMIAVIAMAFAILFANILNFNLDLSSLFFGNIFLVNKIDLFVILILCTILTIFV